MSLLRDPLLLTLLASCLAHGLAFSLDPATPSRPTAAVHSGHTAVRLQPAIAAAPRPVADQLLAPDTSWHAVVPVDLPRTSPVTPQPLHSPPRQAPVTPAPLRPDIPQLASSSIPPAPGRPVRHTPASANRTAPAPSPPDQRPEPPPVRSSSTERLRPSPSTSPDPPRRLPVTPSARRPPTSSPQTPAPQLAVTSPPRPIRPPRPTEAGPAPSPPSLAQPTSRQDRGAARSLPTALPDNPTPDYPAAAARRGRQGVVVVLLRIDETGRVARASVHRSSGHADLDNAALVAARRWTFRPARRGNRAVAITVLKPFRFVLQRR